MRETAVASGYPRLPNENDRRAFDARAGAFLHTHMRITASEASKPGPWAFLTCVLVPDVVRWRFPGRDGITDPERFLGGGGLASRNTLARLWWRADVFALPGEDQPYALLERLGEDELVQFMERPALSGNHVLARTTAAVFLRLVDAEGDLNRRFLLRDALKRLRRLLSFVSFESLEDDLLGTIVAGVFAETSRAAGADALEAVRAAQPSGRRGSSPHGEP
nr:DUF6339 family protein [Deinococcus aestuarii]